MLIIIQARISSKRLPGKVLHKCAGKPILQWVIDRINSLNYPINIVVSTSNLESDDLLVDYCKSKGINYFRGSLDNVIERFIKTCKEYRHKKFIRVCGDSPIIDQSLISQAIEIEKKVSADIITNIFPRTYPKGQSVELISLSALEKLNKSNINAQEMEHVTLGFYNRKENYKIYNFESPNKKYSNMQLSVDTHDDFRKIERLISMEKEISPSNFWNWIEFAKINKKIFNESYVD